jgi:hypothetical protein
MLAMYTSTLLALTTLATFPRVLAQVGVHCGTTADGTSLADLGYSTELIISSTSNLFRLPGPDGPRHVGFGVQYRQHMQVRLP